MISIKRAASVPLAVLFVFVGNLFFRIAPLLGATIALNCNSASLQVAIESAAAGDIIQVTGTCNENILVRNEKQRITIDGAGAGAGTRAAVNGNSSSPAFNVRGKGILIQNFAIAGGSDGINVNRGSNAVINNNLIQNTDGGGIVVQDLAFAVITLNTITNNPGDGILIHETSTARIGFNTDADISASPNTIQGNLGRGITIGNSSGARIVGNNITGNGLDGVGILRDSNAELSGNSISANSADGVLVSENSSLRLVESPEGGIFISANSTVVGSLNGAFGLRCQSGSVAEGVIGTLNGTNGVSNLLTGCIAGTLDQSPIAIADNTSTGTNAQAIFSVLANDSDPDNDPLSVTSFTQGINGTVSCTLSGICTYTPNNNFSGVDIFNYTINDGKGGFTSTTATVTVTPPDPIVNAPQLDRSVATTISKATEFLYTGNNPVQTGVAPGTILPIRAAVLRGRVLTREGTALLGTKVTILNNPQFGQTVSRSDGFYDLAVNGGGSLTLSYTRPGYLPAQRQVTVPWQDYASVPDVVLIPLDTRVTTITPNSSFMQVARGNVVSDVDGNRQATILVPAGTTAQIFLANGTTQSVNNLNVRMTEYTVGSNGPVAMPAMLPPSSGYTYAVEIRADESIAKIGGKDVLLSQPIFFYLENFLSFPVGQNVPTGYYDNDKAAWVPSGNGKVIKILSNNNGFADLDVTGDNVADTGTALSNLGITDAERQRLALLHSPGQTLWRVPITHFSTWDHNWPYGPPGDATAPNQPNPETDETINDGLCESPGSVIECQNQILGETVGIVGTPYTLNYRSDRTPGRVAARTVTVQASGQTVPPSLKRIDVQITIAGRSFIQTLNALPNQSVSFTWDGLDAYGRQVQGNQSFNGAIGYVYDALYEGPGPGTASFGRFGGAALAGNSTRQEITISQQLSGRVGPIDARGIGLGGWTLSVHHIYDPAGQVAFLGSGRRQRSQSVTEVISTLVSFVNLPSGVAAGPDGSVYFSEGSIFARVLRVSPAGISQVVAGTGVFGFTGDGGLATLARLNNPAGIALGADGSVYIADMNNQRIRRVGPNGIISTVAGTGAGGFSGDNGPATQAGLNNPQGVAVGLDGSFYIADTGNRRIRRVGPDGIITTVAGTGVQGFSGDGGPAIQAQLSTVFDLTVGPDGSLYIPDNLNDRIRRVDPNGIINTVAGSGVHGFGGDGGPATQASMNHPRHVALAPDNGFYVADDFNNRIRRVGPDGIIRTVAGTGVRGFSGDGGPASEAQFDTLNGLALGPNGSLYIVDQRNFLATGDGRIRRISPILPGFTAGDLAIPSKDGGLLYQFNPNGRHLRTRHTLTGAVLFEFTYDGAGRLTQVIEKTGVTDNVTTIQRDGSGNPTKIIAPFGQETALTVDANGFLSSIANPANEAVQISYTTDGLLQTLTDPRNKISQYTYDGLGRLTRADDPGGGFQTLDRAEINSFTVTRTTALGRTTTYKVENLSTGSQRLTNTLPDNTQSETELRQDGTQISQPPDGMLLTTVLSPDPRFGMQVPIMTSQTLTPPVGPTTITTSSKTATLNNTSDPLSLTSLTESSAINGRITTMTYTQSTKTGVSTSPAGRTSSVTIDSLGRLASAQISGLNAATVTYDARGRVATITRGSGPSARTTSFGYDAAGLVSSMIDPLGRVTQINYDSAGRFISKVFPDGRVVNITYDAAGNLATLAPPGRPAYTFAYSDRNQLTEFTPPAVAGSGPIDYTLNLDKQLVSVSRPDNRSVLLGYDSGGRVSSRSYSTSGVTTGTDTFTYDSAGRLSTIDAASAVNLQYSYNGVLMTGIAWTGAIAGDVGFAYDNSLRLASASVNGGDTINFIYDNDDYLIGVGALTITRNAQNGLPTATALGSVSTAVTYNGFGEVDSYNATASGSPIFSNIFTYDKLGRITQKTETIGGVTSIYDYTYSLADQLTGVSKDSIATESYAYDDNGNRTSATLGGITTPATYDIQDRLLTYGAITFGYSGAGDLQSKNNGGQITGYQYDQIGNLLSITLPGGTVGSYVIDGRGRRAGKKINNVFTKRFLYGDALRPVAEFDGTGTLINRFVYGDGAVPEYMTKAGVSYRIIPDQVGSVRLVVNTTTGAIAQRIDYDSFGNVMFDSSPGFQPFGFAGGLYDQDTGLVRFGARDYDPSIGRWTIKDPILFDGGDLNLYAYVGSNPVNFTDPGGLDPFDDLLDPKKRGDVFKKINPTVCQQNNCPATANKMFDYLSGKETSAAACLPPGKTYNFEGNYKGVHFTDLVDPLPGGHGTFVQVWGKRTGGESDHQFTIVNIRGKNYIIDAYGGGREPRSDIEKYFKEQGFDLGKFQIRIVQPCEGNCPKQ